MIYTLGNRENYDAGLAQQAAKGGRMLKCGRNTSPSSYPGGSVWETREDAQAYLDGQINALEDALSLRDGDDPRDFEVYGVEADWIMDTVPDVDGGSWHNLLVDAPVVKLEARDAAPSTVSTGRDHAATDQQEATVARPESQLIVIAARRREQGWREELEHVRVEHDEAIRRALEQIRQGDLREHRLKKQLEHVQQQNAELAYRLNELAYRLSCLLCVAHQGRQLPRCAVCWVEQERAVRFSKAEEYDSSILALAAERDRTNAENTRLLEALAATGALGVLAACPSCEADRTNGERHDDDCKLLAVIQDEQARRQA